MTWQETISFLTGCMPRPVARALMQQPGGQRAGNPRARGGKGAHPHCGRGDHLRLYPHPTAGGANGRGAVRTRPLCARRGAAPGICHLARRAPHGPVRPVVAQGQSVRALRDISSLCLRVAGQWRGAADALMPHLWDEQGRVRSLLIVGLPGMGKTTMLRDACRRLS